MYHLPSALFSLRSIMWFFASRQVRLERRAARAFGLKNYAAAVDALHDLLQIVGENPHTLHALAVCRQRQGQYQSAVDAAARGLAADPEHLSCLKILAEAHAALGQMDSARDYAGRALAHAGFRENGRVSAENREWESWARALCASPAGVGNE